MQNNSILEKVKKLLSLVKSDNPNESDLALQKATSLAAEHGIDLAMASLDAANLAPEEKFEGKQETIANGKRESTWQKYVNWILNSHFSVKTLHSGSRYNGRKLLIIGDKNDVEFATYINGFLLAEFDRRWKYYKNTNGLSVKEKQTWAYSAWRGLDTKLKEAKDKTVSDRLGEVAESIRAEVHNKFSLILLDKQQCIDDFVSRLYPSMKKGIASRINMTNNEIVRRDGFSAGYSMNIARPLTGQKCLN